MPWIRSPALRYWLLLFLPLVTATTVLFLHGRGEAGPPPVAGSVSTAGNEPERLVFTEDVSEHPPAWHDLLRQNKEGAGAAVLKPVVTVTFVEQDGKTTMTVVTRFETKVDRDAFVKMGMNEGWRQSFERLDSVLAGTWIPSRRHENHEGRFSS